MPDTSTAKRGVQQASGNPGSSIPASPSDTDLDNVGERLLTFVYRGWLVSCGTRRLNGGCHEPVVSCRPSNSDGQSTRLPADTDNSAYATEAEALRHAEQQGMRWVQERTDRQSDF
ncbi:hypothetical protein SAMN05518845_115199 [Variovorax sp. YR750]|uniref:hypothetical protein n=1 Tax=Variovorax sp. YR750 TaxID=1884384 RepID=UPI0008CBE26F|nr:hypothetical protein [Variovorax sp. YR750]SEM06801.1 hypothetical protein SAMN05518845_115199 [Variovorax sp. YR750]